MRQMNLPELAPVPESIKKELVALVAERLNGPMPFQEFRHC